MIGFNEIFEAMIVRLFLEINELGKKQSLWIY